MAESGLLTIRIYGDPCLRKKCDPVDGIGPAERIFIEALFKTMYAEKGVGLAAPQVGVNRRIFVVDAGDGPLAVVNPQILNREGAAVQEEGCLSIPGVTVEVKRPQTVRVRFKDENNQDVEMTLSDLKARVFLHENDHLDGKLIVDYASWMKKRELSGHLKELERLARQSLSSS